MNSITFSELRRLSSEKLAPLLPLAITYNEIPIALIGKEDEMVVLTGMNINVRQQFKAREKMIRAAMGEQLEPVAGLKHD